MRLFATAAACIWAIVLGFAWTQYRMTRRARIEAIYENIHLANANIINRHMQGLDVKPYMDFMQRYYENSDMRDISIALYNHTNGKLIYQFGKERPYTPSAAIMKHAEETVMPDGSTVRRVDNFRLGKEPIFCYSSRLTPGKQVEIRTYLPLTKNVKKMIEIDPAFWIIILVVGLTGTLMAYIFTAHQAKNVSLLHDFARRAASDRDFIPMGDFPADEIGDISRQIVAIYNSRIQANVRREREHVIALKATEEKNKLKRELTNNISHELKTPIGIIRAYLDTILAQPDMSDDERNHFLGKIHDNVERLVNMLNDLSTMTRLDESKNNIQLKVIDFHDLIFTMADDISRTDMLGEMDFRYNLPLDCRVIGNEGLLTSVVTNLTKNARAYSQGTQVGLELIGRNQNFYTFSFYDNGVGVENEHLPHLFERFYRIDTGRARKSGGTGLGLPIVKSSINSMGGSITVRNRKGGGLEFIFTLRRAQDDKEAGTPAQPVTTSDDSGD